MPETVKLFNTLGRKLEEVNPITPDKLSVYCCGPTVYNYQHIGNLRTYLFEDLLMRALRRAGYEVKHVMNITDVGHLVSDADDGEDKMLLASKREGKNSHEVAEYYTSVFFEHCSWLNIKRPDIVCKATEHIQQMIDLISALEQKGFAYLSGGNVYFDVAKFEAYGDLALLDTSALQAGARIEVDSSKRSPFDFALWFTKSKFENQELQWDSPWGRGYPGWHIECSAMAMHYLGDSFDIHCGGIDHIPVHHSNEIAQSECATGKKFARHWLHGGFLVVGKEKMAKSAGEFLTLDLLKEKGFDPLSYRMFCLSSSYRGELSWSWEALEAAATTLKRVKASVLDLKEQASSEAGITSSRGKELLSEFDSRIYNDLNLPSALAILHETLGESSLAAGEKLALVESFDEVLGFDVLSWEKEEIPAEILALAEKREAARKNKDWAAADSFRDSILAEGYQIKDTADGPKVTKA